MRSYLYPHERSKYELRISPCLYSTLPYSTIIYPCHRSIIKILYSFCHTLRNPQQGWKTWVDMYVLCYLLYICLVTCRLNTFFFLFKFENKLRKEVRLKNIQGILFKILFKLQKAHNAEKHAIFVFGEPNPRFFFFFFLPKFAAWSWSACRTVLFHILASINLAL